MVYANMDLERKLWQGGYKYICGVDEVGRGCFAGPVVAGAVVFPMNCGLIEGVADSKLLNADKRKNLESRIKNQAVCWSIGEIGVDIINKVGIGKATQMAFERAVKNLKISPDFILIDAFLINNLDPKMQEAVKNGDTLCYSIAAASIIAKVYRDSLMRELDDKHPGYNFSKHKGYGTKAHRDAIGRIGLSEIHRKSFNLVKFLDA